MQSFLMLTKALSDESRVRAFLSLRDGELCLCQIVDVLGLSPSTVSKHMDLLYQAGLVQRRKEGRWHYFWLPDKDAPAMVRRGVQWVLQSLENEPALAGDSKKVCCVRRKDLKDLCECYRA
jgi:ArsR family transcriptional regulator, arsenate/arsenite/antimonite-responsive transcriptional repressor